MEDFEIVLIFGDRKCTLCLLDVNNGVGNHTHVAASAGGTKRVDMVNQKLTREALDDEPWLMGR